MMMETEAHRPSPLRTLLGQTDGGMRPTKLFLGGITRNTTTKQLRDHFAQYGRVLDCVAMRQPDGRPRGFGYVTLDSPDAARRCVQEPQVIDNRVIDVKAAVPEGSGSGTPKSMGSDYMEGGNVLQPWWTSSIFRGGVTMDCVDLLSRHSSCTATPSDTPRHSEQLASAFPAFLSDHQSALDPCQVLSAHAPEFVPVPGAVPTPAAERRPSGRAPLGEITNVAQDATRDYKPSADLLKPWTWPVGKTSPTEGSARDIGIENMSDVDSRASMMNFHIADNQEDDDCAMDTELSSQTVESLQLESIPSSNASSLPPTPSSSGRVYDGLPSRGSALHAEGSCKRCNFFAKGRCQNGEECTFCHFPHDKRKATRQEKRERRSSRLLMDSSGDEMESYAPELQFDPQSTLLEWMAGPQAPRTHFAPPPGLDMAALAGPDSWQPDEEITPGQSPANYQPGLTLPVPLPSPTTAAKDCFLATMPLSSPVARAACAVTPTAQVFATTPTATSVGWGSNGSGLQHCADLSAAATQTISTQTDEEFFCLCCGTPRSEEDEAAKPTWTREEMLKHRTVSRQDEPVLFRIRTEAVAPVAEESNQ